MPDASLVLLVDDYAPFRSACAIALRRAGYDVLIAPDGTTARDLLRQWGADIRLIIAGVCLPDTRGDHVVRAAATSIPVVYISSDPAILPSASSEPARACARFAKPFDLATLLDVVARLLRSGVPAEPVHVLSGGCGEPPEA